MGEGCCIAQRGEIDIMTGREGRGGEGKGGHEDRVVGGLHLVSQVPQLGLLSSNSPLSNT